MAQSAPAFNRSFDPQYGQVVEIAPGVRRLCCNNPGPFTWTGTNSYIIGEEDVAILDPGPADEGHISCLLEATQGQRISHILISHSHSDHSPGAALLREHCDAPIYAEGPHRPARTLHLGEINPLDAAADMDLVIDHQLKDGEKIKGAGWCLEAIHTPGHTVNHLAFAFDDGSGLFSADHVMAWSTSIVAPPDGSMADYMASLEKLIGRREHVYWPGHGAEVTEVPDFLAGLKAHRQAREDALLQRLEAGEETIAEMVATVYKDVDRSLHGAAALSMFAQMEYLLSRGMVTCLDEIASLDARYRLT